MLRYLSPLAGLPFTDRPKTRASDTKSTPLASTSTTTRSAHPIACTPSISLSFSFSAPSLTSPPYQRHEAYPPAPDPTTALSAEPEKKCLPLVLILTPALSARWYNSVRRSPRWQIPSQPPVSCIDALPVSVTRSVYRLRPPPIPPFPARYYSARSVHLFEVLLPIRLISHTELCSSYTSAAWSAYNVRSFLSRVPCARFGPFSRSLPLRKPSPGNNTQ